MPATTVTFEDMPILTELGFEAGSLSGRAEVTFDENGEWFVKRIWLDASRRTTAAERAAHPGWGLFINGEIEVEYDEQSPSWLYKAIWGQLTDGRFKRQVSKVVEAEIEQYLPPMAPQRRMIEAVH